MTARTTILAIAATCLFFTGCSREPVGPTYAEATAAYQSELAILDSIQAKIDAMKLRYEKSVIETKKIMEPEIAKSEEWTETIFNEFNDPKMATEKAAESNEHTKNLRAMLQKSLATSAKNYTTSMAILSSDLESQTTRVREAKKIRDAISQ
jgi:hypothetical protein